MRIFIFGFLCYMCIGCKEKQPNEPIPDETPEPIKILSAPINLSIGSVLDSSVALTWDHSDTNHSFFEIEMSPIDLVSFSRVKTVSKTDRTTIVPRGLPTINTYFYRIRAGAVDVVSPFSNSAELTGTGGFEIEPQSWTNQSTTGDAGRWKRVQGIAYGPKEGKWVMTAGPLQNRNDNSVLSYTTKSVGMKTISFWYYSTANPLNNYFRFSINDSLIILLPSTQGWQNITATYSTRGNFTLQFLFSKTAFVVTESERAYIDDVTIR